MDAFDEAIAYVLQVKKKLSGDAYAEFLEILKQYRNCAITIVDVRERVIELFKGEKDLLSGFDAFLPKPCEVVPSPGGELESMSASTMQQLPPLFQKHVNIK